MAIFFFLQSKNCPYNNPGWTGKYLPDGGYYDDGDANGNENSSNKSGLEVYKFPMRKHSSKAISDVCLSFADPYTVDKASKWSIFLLLDLV